ncbi:lipoate--protein ligase family protein [Halalkalibacter akibai]|uniref:Octanoyl-[GcvH]:protein N-octanoyltransferase n=1 Tax=Halalkalibacter akibai (strain ATCC 43226 / DSM 21942 / CIP 109018 / JCM 9157 / 1139) TaxID=1236973 RepID=W4QNC8_HALA3|nr:lipoate--protein ligase family protein [Halalkalibacter akibai]GAE33581.1 lipoate-protein ligase A [Halalkalibacter akibai JCM 9157]
MLNFDLSTLSKHWRFLDHSTFGPQFDALQSFAYDDTLCQFIGQHEGLPTIRAWVHHQTVVLGIQDSRLPFIESGRAFLGEHDYRVIVRNSGGLAVVLDEGVLNISLVIKEEKGFSIDHGYNLMLTLIRKMFASFPVDIQAFEVVGSYCPGSFDLSINGQKFAGISQRRIRGGIAVQIYLCVTGSGSERAKLIRGFYDEAVQGSQTKFVYPTVQPHTMASLSELLGVTLSIQDVMLLLLKTSQKEGVQLTVQPFSNEEQALYSDNYVRIVARNDKALSLS